MIPEMNKMQVDGGKVQFATLNQDATTGPEKQVATSFLNRAPPNSQKSPYANPGKTL